MSLPFVLVPARRLALALAFGAGLAVLASCGGSVSRVSTFQPTRMVSFGDEVSAVAAGSASSTPISAADNGLKYGINFLKVDATTGLPVVPNVIDCTLAPLWNQVLAQSFDFVFAQCNPNARPVTADVVATPGATVSDVEAQVAAYRTAKGFDSKVLVTIMAGLADVKTAYTGTYLAGGRSATARALAIAQVQAAGTRLGNLVNAITADGQGGRVIYATTPDLGYSPYAIKEEAAPGGAGSRQMLTDLTKEFNSQLRLTVTNDGRYAGLVAADEVIQVMAKNPSSFSLANVTLGGCLVTATLPNCDQSTLITATATDGSTVATTPSQHLWADDTRPANNWHGRVGSAADSRARNNPF
jgi:phospholipase/lecithinase/hemolysin